jgi:phosphoribosylamine--glycine ligase
MDIKGDGMMNILLIGSGGREHAIAWKLAQSPQVEKLWCMPGNAGIGQIAALHKTGHWSQFNELLHFIESNQIDMTVIGPEAPLVKGLVDFLNENGKKAFGPNMAASQLEGSKIFCKDFLKRHNIPTADYRVFADFKEAREYVQTRFENPANPAGFKLVIKADGLAAGKGVFICGSYDEAETALSQCMAELVFGDAGKKVIVEECLNGREVSLLAFTDGHTIVPMVTAQDYKRVFDNQEGPNTGGMGSISPSPVMTPQLQEEIMKTVMIPTISGLNSEGITYKGVLYAGLMIVDNIPYVLEFNCRFGDPETQVILPRLKTDLVDIMMACIDGKLDALKVEWDSRAALCVVLASGGYPGAFRKGLPISGLEEFNPKDPDPEAVRVFYADTEMAGNQVVTNGGRVLNVVTLAKDLPAAREKVYKALRKIHFEKMHHRKDIGADYKA